MRMLKSIKHLPLISLSIVLGSISTILITSVFAHGGDISKIHACVRNSTLIPGAPNIRIVGENDNCNNNETPLDWTKEATLSDLVCSNCTTRDILHRLNQPDLTNVNLDEAILSLSLLNNFDISGSSFIYAVLTGVSFNGTNGSDSNFSNANLRSASIQESANFTRAKFINADMVSGSFDNSIFIDADFTNANLTNAFLNNSVVTGANFTGVIWNNTFCPDGTNSNDNGGTCEGHLTP